MSSYKVELCSDVTTVEALVSGVKFGWRLHKPATIHVGQPLHRVARRQCESESESSYTLFIVHPASLTAASNLFQLLDWTKQ